MATKTMSMHRLLAELKTYDDRIRRTMNDGHFVFAAKTSLTKIGTQTPEELKAEMKATLQSVCALISNKKVLEAVKMATNAITKVSIGEREYTVADAIKRKADIRYENELLKVLVAQYNAACRETNINNEKMERNMETQITNLYGNSDKADKAADIEAYVKTYRENNEWDIIDPNSILELINSMRDEITIFVTEVDAVLSESNAITMVTVELDD